MPTFSAFAGPSPNCDAVLVQIAHCASALKASEKSNTITNDIFNNPFIDVANIQLLIVNLQVE